MIDNDNLDPHDNDAIEWEKVYSSNNAAIVSVNADSYSMQSLECITLE